MEFLEKLYITDSWLGLFHTVTAIMAMIFGTIVLLGKKGTQKHRKIGYVYVVNMLLLNVSAFGIYNFGGPSLFHVFALISLVTVFMGLIPAIKKNNSKWYGRHFYYMCWSVVGLYCAFWAEIGTRLLDIRYFWWAVLLATLLTSFAGARMIKREARRLNLA